MLKLVQQRILNQQAQGFVTLQRTLRSTAQTQESPVQKLNQPEQGNEKVSLDTAQKVSTAKQQTNVDDAELFIEKTETELTMKATKDAEGQDSKAGSSQTESQAQKGLNQTDSNSSTGRTVADSSLSTEQANLQKGQKISRSASFTGYTLAQSNPSTEQTAPRSNLQAKQTTLRSNSSTGQSVPLETEILTQRRNEQPGVFNKHSPSFVTLEKGTQPTIQQANSTNQFQPESNNKTLPSQGPDPTSTKQELRAKDLRRDEPIQVPRLEHKLESQQTISPQKLESSFAKRPDRSEQQNVQRNRELFTQTRNVAEAVQQNSSANTPNDKIVDPSQTQTNNKKVSESKTFVQQEAVVQTVQSQQLNAPNVSSKPTIPAQVQRQDTAKNIFERQRKIEVGQNEILKKMVDEIPTNTQKLHQSDAVSFETDTTIFARQKVTLLAQQVQVESNSAKAQDVDLSKALSIPQSIDRPTIVLNATQVRLILDNLSRYVKHVSSETTQFKQVKQTVPESIKITEPIKIETFKLTVAKDIKQIDQEPLYQKTEKLENTEQLREALNNKLAKRTYEQEQPTVQHVRVEQRDVEQIVVRVEQQQRSDNLQSIVETIRQMRETFTERAEVQLSPPSLGKLEIELVKQQDRLTILMKVSTPEAKEILENSTRELTSRLSSLGFKVEQIEVRMNPKFEQEQAQEERENNQQFTQNEQQQRKREREDDEHDQRD